MSTPATSNPKRPGRRRDESLTVRILEAAREEIATVGAADFSIRQVARRAEVSRKTITARWQNADELLLAAIGAIDLVEFEPTGDLESDLFTLGAMFVDGLRSDTLELQLRLTADAGKHPEAYSLLQRHVLEPRSRALAAALRAAQKTGQIRDGEVTWLVRAFFGALLSCTFQHPNRSSPSADELRELIAQMKSWAAPEPSRSDPSSRRRRNTASPEQASTSLTSSPRTR
ncbi:MULTISPECIES: TetR/AcrR family transcriptional regulator [unclassified Rhodococcus (in: high G+C Gram-positive bacteria)]|uniref:TetR/AcrR family transcriptional regulator n=1 Tax=unclassified Rhodococcus (in: high G+C Gram-positive bacteria) TaxID=192944 RepID=UPI000933407D|nr:TetR/AcrR family transcriptional regulator [Rhodococcus sp. M8]OLL20297.1 TetR family transcriptional regulator [Rhodococcus sp. M8]